MYLCFLVLVISSSLYFHIERELKQEGSAFVLSFFPVHLLPVKDIRCDSPGDSSPLSTQKVQSARGWDFTLTLFQQYVSINNALRNFQEPPAEVKGMSDIKTN